MRVGRVFVEWIPAHFVDQVLTAVCRQAERRFEGVASAMRPDELERRLRARLDALGPAPRAELLRVLMLPDFERADRLGEFWGYPESRAFAELLIDCEEDRTPSGGAGWDAAGGREAIGAWASRWEPATDTFGLAA
jgi:hypothetical protein